MPFCRSRCFSLSRDGYALNVFPLDEAHLHRGEAHAEHYPVVNVHIPSDLCSCSEGYAEVDWLRMEGLPLPAWLAVLDADEHHGSRGANVTDIASSAGFVYGHGHPLLILTGARGV